MTTAAWSTLGVVALLLLYSGLSYNRFVGQRNLIRDSWANIDTELRRRYDLIPNLVEAIKGYASHERTVLESVTSARASAVAATGSPEEQAEAENALVSDLRRLMVVAESYPTLRASENFLALQQELAITEDRIQAARRFYNANVRDYNRRVQSIPSNVVAGTFGLKTAQYFEVQEAVRTSVPGAGSPTAPVSTGPPVSPAAPGPPAAPGSGD
ncbi:MAG: LemA family protein [Actinomycetota bacterium]